MAGNFNLDDYVQVNERVEKFYLEYPQGSIQTEIISNIEDKVIIKAYVYRDQEDKRPCTGHAMEKEGSTFINKSSHIENCETSAIGRALAMMGYEIKKSIASKEEVANAKLNQDTNKSDLKGASGTKPTGNTIISQDMIHALVTLGMEHKPIISVETIKKTVLKDYKKTRLDSLTLEEYNAIKTRLEK